jgi:hypothetical protein
MKQVEGERVLPFLRCASVFSRWPTRCGKIPAIFVPEFSSSEGPNVAKQAVFRQVKSLNVGCDAVGNILLVKFAYHGGTYSTVFFPASIVFWMLEHIPVNQDPQLQPPAGVPQFTQMDWDDRFTPRALSVNCKQFPDALRIRMELERTPEQTVLLDRANVELLRHFFTVYAKDLINLDAA